MKAPEKAHEKAQGAEEAHEEAQREYRWQAALAFERLYDRDAIGWALQEELRRAGLVE